MQALMLAAGMGRRLGKYTNNQTKCMVRVGGKTLLEHTVDALKEAGIARLVMVIGYEADRLREFIQNSILDIDIEFVVNPDYAQTNNIYSLYLAREQLTQDDTIMVESDLIYEHKLIRELVEYPYENVAVVAKYEQWMDGTVTILTEDSFVKDFVEKKDFFFSDAAQYYKTVNIYKFSKEFSKNSYLPFLEAYIHAYGKNQYYESVLKTLAHISNANLKAYIVSDKKWYEIDDAQDLDIARTLFAPEDEQLLAYERHFGGYWRFSGLKDFCYLVNPYFPPKKMLDQMKYFFDPLLRDYPSGMSIQKLLAEKMFHIDEGYLLVGNGAAELITTLGRVLKGKVALTFPAFNEYIRCFPNCEITPIYSRDDDFRLNKQRFIELAQEGHALFLINPDNPSGSFLSQKDVLEILDVCQQSGVTCVVDESFIDFAAREERYTMLENDILEHYDRLIVIKSISKSYGVPGIRLGVLASSDQKLVNTMRYLLPVWNINSFAEYFLQIYGLYAVQYQNACDEIAKQRDIFSEKLRSIHYIKLYGSSANYIMCKVIGEMTSKQLATRLLRDHDLLIKDLSEKDGFFGENYIRVAVKDYDENESLYQALKELDQ